MLYPNPAVGQANVSAGWFEDTQVSIRVYNSAGQILINHLHEGGPSVKLDVSNFGKGIYIINCMSDEFSKTVKLII